MKKFSLFGALLLSACVTINIYFPAAAAEKAADEIIKDIQNAAPAKPEPKSALDADHAELYRWIDVAVGTFISNAEAAEADLSIDSAEIRQLRASMEKRFAALQPNYAAGYIGIKSDGFLTVREGANVPLKERNQVTKLVAAENKDRQSLYQAIANANGHPEWLEQIKSTFAARWISNAQAGWWVQSSNGSWKQK
ncbi:YdbL family protein [Methylomicrobium sp. Wu6]|uniref:YdbL family protein n=1 Tax=Methylomicrobium sp. Wu6 TaxID=3107928 RepID=UPI002DD69797|nr:YdbL family protein [Methylomicrobium sp. Wu6]MEC4748719.1 YdbL family protein [Methylomicrobium sp. Wu6]